jgi:hypothetical protein
LAAALYKVNDWIDRCADQTSEKYIWHEVVRKIECDKQS